MSKAELRRIYTDWKEERIEVIELIEAVAKFLGEPSLAKSTK